MSLTQRHGGTKGFAMRGGEYHSISSFVPLRLCVSFFFEILFLQALVSLCEIFRYKVIGKG